MKKITLLASFSIAACLFFSFTVEKKMKRILVYSKTKGYHHASIPAGIAAIQKLGAENRFAVDTTTDSTFFTKRTLKKYAAVVFMSTTGNVLTDDQQAAFEKYIRGGGGFVGIHAATDTEYDWPWYNKLVGAYFKSHPKQQKAIIQVVDSTHISTRHLPQKWERFDEWYNFKSLQNGLHVLLTIDEKSYTGGENGDVHPMAWYHDFDGGRSFYTELGHTDESFSDPLYLRHLLGGIRYAMKD
ncbi:ThuA domain-containing protein [Sediminibacterium roseum]|uniref:ThuA domain-containing protein n=1 Tax=Sediminibacterium roseum TaxID=1978412 RepID=A0ABW9ZV73_9BACT|nr:ThuA domain-containing protein [Sediminibacterium roseum]NCI51040.1 ThuA domain-containing protein [Sediminibacterium roseum]